jgi:tetratricopeptide (TPR) repeat protein
LNKQTFIQLIKDPSGITPEQLQELEKVVAGFPYCQDAHILIARQAAETGSMLADQKLKKAAAYTLDRKNLKKIVTGSKTRELTEIKKEIVLKEIPVIEKQEEPVSTISPEEKAEKIESEEIKTPVSEIKQEEIKSVETPIKQQEQKEERKVPNEAFTDEKRDQIIRELQENLKRLHDSKIKAAWEEVPDEVKVIGINVDPVKKEEKTVQPDEPVALLTPEYHSEETSIIQQETSEVMNWINPEINYPIRTEDVVVEVKETEADTQLLLEYLDFLEERRGIFKKNKKKEEEIIQKIIKAEPTIPKLDINNLPDSSVDLSSKSITISKEPVSENFAKILGLQGKREKAIEIYEQLILKNPEKKPYFEAQIEKLKNKL